MIDSYGIHLGPLYVHFYALILMAGMAAAAWLTAYRAKQQGFDPDHVWNGLMWVLVPAVIGARIYHILTPTPASGLTTLNYLQHPLEMLAIWNGGLGIYGGIVGGALGILIYARQHQLPIVPWLDLAVPGLALGQAIGRWGNYVNQEIYGAPTTLPWAVTIPPEKRVPGYEQFSTFHPLFLYESLWNVASLGLLLWIERRFRDRLRDGDLVLVYLVLYPVGRFLLDYVRLDSNGFGLLTTAQLVSLGTCVVAGSVLVLRHRRPRTQTPAELKSSLQPKSRRAKVNTSRKPHGRTR